MLRASVIGVLLAATLLAPEVAYAYGRATPTPDAFANWRETAALEAMTPARPHRVARYARRSYRYGQGHAVGAGRYAASRYRSGAAGYAQAYRPTRWTRRPILARHYGAASGGYPSPYRVASLGPFGAATDAGSPEGQRGSATSLGAPSGGFGGGDVVAEASRYVGSGKFTGLPGPWCADAVSAWLQRSGHRPLNGRMASAALAYGPRLAGPEVGSLAVLGSRRGWAYHVGVVSGVEPNGTIHLISGNWGHRVVEAVIPRGSVSAFVGVR